VIGENCITLEARMLRIALFGTGRHVHATLRYAGVKLVAVADTLDTARHHAKQCCE
jgi:hypothetical protein